ASFLISILIAGQSEAANVLSNPGFETGNLGGWTTYGANTSVLNNPAAAHSGNDYFKVYQAFNSQINYNGIFQDNVSGPGAVYSADGWAYTLSTDTLAGQNEAWIEVSFRDASGNVLALYRSSIITTNAIATGAFPKNTWVDLNVTNQYDPNTYAITNTVSSLVAPTGTSFVRYQIMFQGDQYNSAGSMYFDDATLNQTSATAFGPNWNIVWSDEFNGNSLNTKNWTYDIGNGCPNLCGWGNNELEYYTSNTQNVYVANGCLHIAALNQQTNYTSGRIKSLGLVYTTYGRVEWRAQLPWGTGFWPALWMLPESSPYGGWPNSGEIDVMENNGSVTNQEGGTIHYGGEYGDVYSGKTYTFPGSDSVTNFHVYLLEWSTNAINWYVDGHLYETQTNWWSNVGTTSSKYPYPAPFNVPFYILMNVAIGGNYLGNPSTTQINASLPGQMLVDYVRFYNQTDPLQLSATKSKGKIVLSWPTNVVCHLQSQTNSLGANWTDVTGSTNPFVAGPPSGAAAVYYRLESP
ncbi:MAG TPA: family 16 glycosylhydrolase, partial [Candidatus Acidoferrales bacterium]|nr:family 16 glycosylhydrolase [Candidatus Acidoferrales bacterium]